MHYKRHGYKTLSLRKGYGWQHHVPIVPGLYAVFYQ